MKTYFKNIKAILKLFRENEVPYVKYIVWYTWNYWTKSDKVNK